MDCHITLFQYTEVILKTPLLKLIVETNGFDRLVCKASCCLYTFIVVYTFYLISYQRDEQQNMCGVCSVLGIHTTGLDSYPLTRSLDSDKITL